jgi:hypothetical protein
MLLVFHVFSGRGMSQSFETSLEKDEVGTWLEFPSATWYEYQVEQSSDLSNWTAAPAGKFYGNGNTLRYLVTEEVKASPPGNQSAGGAAGNNGGNWMPVFGYSLLATRFAPPHDSHVLLSRFGPDGFHVLVPTPLPPNAYFADVFSKENGMWVILSVSVLQGLWNDNYLSMTPELLTPT